MAHLQQLNDDHFKIKQQLHPQQMKYETMKNKEQWNDASNVDERKQSRKVVQKKTVKNCIQKDKEGIILRRFVKIHQGYHIWWEKWPQLLNEFPPVGAAPPEY